MAAQPKPKPTAEQRRTNAQLLADLLGKSEHRLRRQATRHAQLPEDVEDALQSAYALFLERFRGDCEPLAWLYTTVKREAWARGRQTARRQEISLDCPIAGTDATFDLSGSLPSDVPEPQDLTERRDDLAQRRQALAELKHDERQALWLLALGLSYAEICEETGWTHTKVNRCLSEGRGALKKILDTP